METPYREKDVERFDTWARSYEHSWLQRVLFDRVHRATLTLAGEIVVRPACILDAGCGTGKLLRLAGMRWPHAQLIGIDPAAGMIEMAQRLTPDATFFVCPVETLPLQDASVDLVLTTLSFHHWQDQVAGLCEIARILRPGGHLILADASFPGWLVRAARTHRFHSLARLRTLFTQAGLQVQLQRRVFWSNVSATVGKKSWPEPLDR